MWSIGLGVKLLAKDVEMNNLAETVYGLRALGDLNEVMKNDPNFPKPFDKNGNYLAFGEYLKILSDFAKSKDCRTEE